MTQKTFKTVRIALWIILLISTSSACKQSENGLNNALIKALGNPVAKKAQKANSKDINPTEADVTAQSNSIKSCPEEAMLFGSPFPKGKLQWCAYKDSNGDEVKHGEFRVWHANGVLKAQSFYQDGELDGIYKEWYENEKPKETTIYSKGKKHGKSVVFTKDGKPFEQASYLNDEKTGAYVKYGKGNAPLEKGMFDKGLKTGVWEFYTNNGDIREKSEFNAGVRHGKTEKYGRNKAMLASGFYDHDQEIGHWAYYDYRGFKSTEGNLFQGKKHGKWVDYNPSGQKIRVNFFDNGRRIDSYKIELAEDGSQNKSFGNRDVLGAEPPARRNNTAPKQVYNKSEKPKPLAKEGGWSPL